MSSVCVEFGEIIPGGGQVIEVLRHPDIEGQSSLEVCSDNEECRELNECFSHSKMFFQEKQEFHGIIYQGNREYFRPGIVKHQASQLKCFGGLIT